jgi:hypothetical protein
MKKVNSNSMKTLNSNSMNSTDMKKGKEILVICYMSGRITVNISVIKFKKKLTL